MAGDGNDGNRIHVCGGDTSDQIGSARSGGSHADTDLSGGSRIAVRRVGSSLLMGGEDVTDLLVMFIEFIINIQDRAAGITENGIHSLLFQTFSQRSGNLLTSFFFLQLVTYFVFGISRIAPRFPDVTMAA